jgi:multidrug resistance efflux pump
MGGMIALGTAAVYKMSKKDVQRVEEYTGKTAEELSDEELKAAIEDLQIQVDELSDAEWAEVEKADAEEEKEDDYIEQVERLAELHEKGILTDEEFEAKKKELLGL